MPFPVENIRHHALVTTVPQDLRIAIFAQLQALVRGDLPELLTWVQQYKGIGTALVTQPMEIWTHRDTEVTPTRDGGWHVVVPLWTSDESPSDLSAEVTVAPDGRARITSVHVL